MFDSFHTKARYILFCICHGRADSLATMDCCAKVARNPKIKKKDLGGEKMAHGIHQPPRLTPDNTNSPTSAVEAPESREAESGSGSGSGVGGGVGGGGGGDSGGGSGGGGGCGGGGGGGGAVAVGVEMGVALALVVVAVAMTVAVAVVGWWVWSGWVGSGWVM